MGRSGTKETDVAPSVPERRSLRSSKPLEEEAKTNIPPKSKKLSIKKKEEKVENKSDNQDEIEEVPIEKNNHDSDAETPVSKPTTSRRSSRKRRLSDDADVEDEEDSEKRDDKNDEVKDGKNDEKEDKEGSQDDDIEEVDKEKDEEKDEREEKAESETTELKNGKVDGASKGKAKKRKRKPPIKKKKVEEQDESEMWTPLEPLGEERKDAQKKTQSKSDRRKQALVERQAPAEPMLQKQLRRSSDASECVVLGSVRSHRRPRAIVTVDIDDEASETGSIQIVAEPDVDSVFDFKRLLIQYRNVNLPSSLWGVHKDPRNQFVSFTRFNPDYPETNGVIVDRAVVFQGSLNPEAFISGEKIELPEMFNIVETSYEASQVIEFVNNTVSPAGLSHSPEETSDTC